jgi:hypothetical protein
MIWPAEEALRNSDGKVYEVRGGRDERYVYIHSLNFSTAARVLKGEERKTHESPSSSL